MAATGAPGYDQRSGEIIRTRPDHGIPGLPGLIQATGPVRLSDRRSRLAARHAPAGTETHLAGRISSRQSGRQRASCQVTNSVEMNIMSQLTAH